MVNNNNNSNNVIVVNYIIKHKNIIVMKLK